MMNMSQSTYTDSILLEIPIKDTLLVELELELELELKLHVVPRSSCIPSPLPKAFLEHLSISLHLLP